MGVFMGFVIQSSDTTAINGIRQLVSLQLTAANLPDATIAGGEFLRAGEFAVYKTFGWTNNDQYLSHIGLNRVTYEFPRSFIYREEWMASNSYSINDIVYQGSPENLYYANKTIASGTAFSQTDWTRIPVDFKGEYSSPSDMTDYDQYDVVREASNLYYATNAIENARSTFDDNQWTQITSPTQNDEQKDREERIRIAAQYETAIRLLLSLPQLLEEQILRERLRYQEIDWEKRIEFYRDEITMILEPIVPPGTIFADASAIFGEVKQFVAF